MCKNKRLYILYSFLFLSVFEVGRQNNVPQEGPCGTLFIFGVE